MSEKRGTEAFLYNILILLGIASSALISGYIVKTIWDLLV